MKNLYTFLVLAFTVFVVDAQIVTIPDANFKAKLLSATASNLVAKNLSGAYFKIDANNDGEIQQSEANAVSELNMNYQLSVNGNYVYITDPTGITSFTNLTKVNFQNNRIVTLNISGMQYLTSIDCSNNSQYLATLIVTNLPSLLTLSCQSAGSNVSNPVYTFQNLPVIKIINFSGCRFYTDTLDNLTSVEELNGYAGFKSTVTNINLSNKPNLKIIDFGNGSLATINFAANNSIETIKVSGNDLTTFDKTLFTNLKYLDLSWNQLPGLDVSNMATLETLNCDNASTSFTYDFTSLNVQGCTNLQKLICSRNVLLHLNLSNLTNLNFLDCYGNNDIFTNTGLLDIALENCTALKDVIVNSNPYLTFLDLSCSANTFNQIRVQNCTNLQKINLKNGVNQSTMNAGLFSYYSCPNLALVGVDFNESFTFLPTSIAQSPYYSFTPNCRYNTVLGNVRFDIEGDGCQNNNGIGGIKINYNFIDPNCFTFSGSNGNFTLYTQANSVAVTPSNELFPLWDFGLTGPVVVNFSQGNIVQNIDLCLAPNAVHNNLEVTILPLDFTTPGIDAIYKIVYKNKGNQIQSGTVHLSFDDAKMDFVAANPAISSSAVNSVNWSFSNLQPFETREILVTFNINTPMETPPVNGGDILAFVATVAGSLSDENPEDNTATLNVTVVNSFDPNNKICLEGATIALNSVGKYVHYIINFENNGTANARNIVIRDVIDTTKFEIATLEPVNSSHAVYTRVNNGNEVEFIFENINLPFDDATNDGYVAFKIKTKSTLVVGNSFSNKANIYFDYNYPIVTNTATTIITALATQDFDFGNYFSIYPNPASTLLNFETKAAIGVKSIDVYNTLGQLVIAIPNTENITSIDVSDLKTGTYFIKVNTDKGTANSKFVKE